MNADEKSLWSRNFFVGCINLNVESIIMCGYSPGHGRGMEIEIEIEIEMRAREREETK